MRFRLLEDYGESNQLDDFVYLSNGRFKTYYRVTLARKDNYDDDYKYSNRYFAYEDAAKDYYNGLIEDIKNDRVYYEFSNATLTKVTLEPDEDELEEFDSIIEFDDEEEEVEETNIEQGE